MQSMHFLKRLVEYRDAVNALLAKPTGCVELIRKQAQYTRAHALFSITPTRQQRYINGDMKYYHTLVPPQNCSHQFFQNISSAEVTPV